MSDRQRIFTNTPWEEEVGYCRAIRIGDVIHVTGTAPVDEAGNVVSPGDGYAQAHRCFEIIQTALRELDTDMSSVVRTRMFVTDISKWRDFGRAHHEFFESHPPATSMIEVSGLIDPSMMIEIEAEAICAG